MPPIEQRFGHSLRCLLVNLCRQNKGLAISSEVVTSADGSDGCSRPSNYGRVTLPEGFRPSEEDEEEELKITFGAGRWRLSRKIEQNGWLPGKTELFLGTRFSSRVASPSGEQLFPDMRQLLHKITEYTFIPVKFHLEKLPLEWFVDVFFFPKLAGVAWPVRICPPVYLSLMAIIGTNRPGCCSYATYLHGCQSRRRGRSPVMTRWLDQFDFGEKSARFSGATSLFDSMHRPPPRPLRQPTRPEPDTWRSSSMPAVYN